MSSNNYVVRLVFSIFGAVIFTGLVSAQINNRVPIVDAAKNNSGTSRAPRAARTAGITKVYQKPIIRTEKVRVSNLTVTTEPGAKVVLEAVKPAAPFKKELVAGAEQSVVFDDIKPGRYKVQASKDGFETAEADDVTISPQKAHGLAMDLKPVTYKLKIQTNVNAGEVFYARADDSGKGAAGSISSNRLGNYCVVKIQPRGQNGDALVLDLQKGNYYIDIRPDALEYEEFRGAVSVPKDVDQDDDVAIKTFQIDLDKKISTETFSTTWSQTDWVMPTSWSLDRGMKIRNGDGIALPRNERFRHYVKFELIANVKLKDERSVGFALRAQDDKNYYLLQISGAKAAQPNTATLFAIKDGVAQPINSATTVAFSKTIASDSGFRVIVRGDNSGFTVLIEDSDTGQTHAVGRLTDQYDTYRKGAIGIVAPQRSNFEVNYFEVCTPSCPK